MKTCETCRYWVQSADPDEGECRVAHPVVVVLADGCGASDGYTYFPDTDSDDWCGEHQDRGQDAS